VTGNLLRKNEVIKLTLIREALLGIEYHSQNPEAMLFPFLDIVMLLHQRELIIALWENARCVDVFLKDPAFLIEFTGDIRQKVASYCHKIQSSSDVVIVKLKNGPYGISFHVFTHLKNIPQTGLPTEIDYVATKLTKKLFHDKRNTFFDDKFYETINLSIKNHIIRITSSDEISNVCRVAISDEEVFELLQPIELALNDILMDIGNVGSYLTLPTEIPNIFSAIRFYREFISENPQEIIDSSGPQIVLRKKMYDYTAKLLLQDKTENQIRNWCKKEEYTSCTERGKGFEDCINSLKQILGLDARVSADLVFSSGIIAFGVPTYAATKQQYKEEKSIQKARDTEECIYYNKNPIVAFYPIHINGSPWLAMYTLTTNDNSWEAWLHNYLFYRQLLQNIPGLIKLKSQGIFLDLLVECIIKHIKSGLYSKHDLFVNAVNQSICKVCQIYPFPQIKFLVGSNSKNYLIIPGIGRIDVSVNETNPYFEMHSSSTHMSSDYIIKQCQLRLDRFGNRQHFIAAHGLGQMTHMLKKPLDDIKRIAKASRNENISFVTKRIFYLHDAAAMILSNKKQSAMISRFREVMSLVQCVKLIEEEYKSIVDALTDQIVNDDSPKVKLLLKDKGVPVINELPDVNVELFKPLIFVAIDGLLTNAIYSIDISNGYIEVRLKWHNNCLKLEVENSTTENSDGLERLLSRLNFPDPDMIGITNIHSFVKGFWGSRKDVDNCVVWKRAEGKGKMHIVAEVLLAQEVEE